MKKLIILGALLYSSMVYANHDINRKPDYVEVILRNSNETITWCKSKDCSQGEDITIWNSNSDITYTDIDCNGSVDRITNNETGIEARVEDNLPKIFKKGDSEFKRGKKLINDEVDLEQVYKNHFHKDPKNVFDKY